MRIDKEKLASLSRLSDEELWEVVSGIAAKNGIKLPSNAPLPTDMATRVSLS